MNSTNLHWYLAVKVITQWTFHNVNNAFNLHQCFGRDIYHIMHRFEALQQTTVLGKQNSLLFIHFKMAAISSINTNVYDPVTAKHHDLSLFWFKSLGSHKYFLVCIVFKNCFIICYAYYLCITLPITLWSLFINKLCIIYMHFILVNYDIYWLLNNEKS